MVVDFSTPLTLGGVVTAFAGMVVGFAVHELTHIGALLAVGQRPTLSFDIRGLTFAAMPEPGTPRWQNAVALLAPVGTAAVGTWALFAGATLSVPLSVDGLLLLAGFLIGALPSPADIYVLLLYRPEAATSEVAADG